MSLALDKRLSTTTACPLKKSRETFDYFDCAHVTLDISLSESRSKLHSFLPKTKVHWHQIDFSVSFEFYNLIYDLKKRRFFIFMNFIENTFEA